MRPQRTPAKTPRSRTPRSGGQTDPVEVCCRIRTLPSDVEESCIEIKDDKSLRMQSIDGKALECQFSRILGEKFGQDAVFESVARPMVDGMLKGKNGLLFTYGVTSSGKTYTMTGTVERPGFLPRSLDMLFNTLEGMLATKYVFVPDNMNGFSVQSEADAMLEKQEREILPRTTTPMKPPNKSRIRPEVRYEIDYCRSENVNPEMRYAVFISYVEIYNDYVYDLLEEIQYDPFSRPKPPQSKRLREDKKHNMFVYGVTEVEITTTEGAFSVFRRGQERRRIAHTQLNAESSRSHSIFNIRLVQAPLDPLGEDYLLQDKSLICVSQLSLVDLAGSERLTRTNAAGERMREAGNINSSLMTLRRCLEQLRENQKNGGLEMVKYRNSKVTHLFKMFFEGRGQVKMVVCVNPSIREYDENVHVMQFAEMAQQVEVGRAEEYHLDRESVKRKAEEAKKKAEEERRCELTAAKKLNSELSGNSLFQRGKKKCRRNLSVTSQSSDTDTTTSEPSPLWVAPELSLGPPFPSIEVVDFGDNNTVPELIAFLSERMKKRDEIQKTASKWETQLRLNIINSKDHDTDLKNRLKEYQNTIEDKTRDISRMEKQIKKLEAKNQVLTKTTQVFENDKKTLNEHLTDTNLQLKESQLDNRKMENRMRGAIANQKTQCEKQCERRVRTAQTEMQEKMWVKEERLRQLKNIIAEGREGRPTTRRTPMSTSSLTTSESTSSGASKTSKLSHKRRSRSAENLLATNKALNKSRRISTSDHDLRRTNKPPKKSISASVVYDPALPIAQKHSRGKSSGGNNWLAHQPSSTLVTGTIMQPCVKPGKIVHVPSPKDIKNADKYLLTHQKEDRAGEIETQLIKGEVIATRSGGQQVKFVDIETLKQRDPQKAFKKGSPRKRKSGDGDDSDSGDQSSWTDVETRCSVAIENKATSSAGPVIYNHPKRRK